MVPVVAAAGVAMALAPASGAVTFEVLGQTGGALGFTPRGGVVMDAAGNLWGTSANGGAGNAGVIWRLNAGGGLEAVHSFSGADGRTPLGQLSFDKSGRLFGVTAVGGAFNTGTIWSIDTASGAFTSHASFSAGVTGFSPQSGMIHDGAGTFYGVTFGGVGATQPRGGVYRFSVDGGLQQIAAFTTAGAGPRNPIGTLALVDGRLVGTSSAGGPGEAGTVFALNSDGSGLAILSSLPSSVTGRNQGVTQGPDGALYGLLEGQLYRVDPTGPTVLATFEGATSTASEMIVDAAGNLFGTIRTGGAFGQGYVFRFSPGDTALTVLHSFQGFSNQGPEGRLFADASGNLYGASSGAVGVHPGVIWRLSGTGFVPFGGGQGAGAVPEPGSWALMIGGFGLVGAAARRRRQGQPRLSAA